MTIDLHGMSHHAAVNLVEDRLLKQTNIGSFDCEIITGKSAMMQRIIKNEVLEKWGFDYVTFPDNDGVIYVSYTLL